MNKLSLSLAEIKAQLSGLELFQHLPEDVLDELCSGVEVFSIEGGEYLLRKGDPGDCMYVVSNGRLRVITEPGEGKLLAELGEGQTLGEMALISEEPRMAFVQACRHSHVLRLSKERFERIIIQWPKILLKISKFLVDRLKSTGVVARKKANIKTVTLVPLCRATLFSEFSQKLMIQLEKEGQVLSLSSRTLNQVENSTTGSNWDANNLTSDFIKTLNGKESQYRFIIFVTDKRLTSWTKFCLRQADRILLVGAAQDSPDLNKIETFIFDSPTYERTAAIELYLLHQSRPEEIQDVTSERTNGEMTYPDHFSKKIVGTNAWLDKRSVFRHHHILLSHTPHFERTARFLSGKAVGLVIGGGGARGGGALGVIRALREKGIPIDMVGGTSIGSMISGLMALGYPVETILQKLMTMTDSVDKSSLVTLPVLGLAAGKGMDKVMLNLFGEQYMEDLWMNCFTVSTNLSTGETVVLCQGLLHKACRSSSGLPGFVEPVIWNGDILTDGALVNNLPSDVMSDLCEGYIILINLLPEEGFVMDSQSMPSAGKIIASKLNPFTKSLKTLTIYDILMRAFTISNYTDLKKAQGLADLYFKPPIQDYGYVQPKVYEKTMKIGYEYAINRLRDFNWHEAH